MASSNFPWGIALENIFCLCPPPPLVKRDIRSFRTVSLHPLLFGRLLFILRTLHLRETKRLVCVFDPLSMSKPRGILAPMHLSEGATQLLLHVKLQCYVEDISSQWCFPFDILYKTRRFFRLFFFKVEEVRRNSGKAGAMRILP